MKRRVILGAALAAAGIAATGAWLTHAAGRSRERALLRHAGADLAFADSLERAFVTRRAAAISDAEALAALYLHRLRLGLGSPFRLIDQVVRDPALRPIGADRLADAMLARTMIGDAFLPRATAMDLVAPAWAPAGDGARHQDLIDSVVAAADDPRVGELTVRLAYRLAEASGTVSRRAPEIATAAAAQARDRILAMRDARRLLAAAERGTLGNVATMQLWRETRRFAVERPVLTPLGARAERDAVAGLPALVARLEALSVGSEGDALVDVRSPGERRLSDALAVRMAAVAAQRNLPPLAPVTVAVRGYSALLASRDDAAHAARSRFVSRSQGEETLAAEYALLTLRAGRALPAADATVLTAAVGLRPFAQDQSWVPGDAGPTVRDVQARLGVAVTHDPSTPVAWRPFLHRALDAAIADMRRVLPGFDPRGLRVHFGASPLGDRALAMHDPVRRTIYFPPTSSTGVMAHEFAHDLDWQAARREFGGGGWYRTDHALRRSSDRLAGALRQMASAARVDSPYRRAAPGERVAGSVRPTEIMARNVDWFVSAQLAREGRVNGYLTAAQDPVLTGFASAITPEAARDGGDATLRALDGLTAIPGGARRWFSSLFGAERRVTVHEAVRRVLEAPLARVSLSTAAPAAPMWEWPAGRAGSGASWSCLMDGLADRANDAAAVRAVVQYAAESRARGVTRQWAGLARSQPGAGPLRLRALMGGPWDPALATQTHRDIRDAILLSALSPRRELGELRWATSSSQVGRC